MVGANSLLMEQQIKNNMIEEIYNYDFKTVCTKEQVYLKREKSCNIFLLQFNLENKNKNLYDIINLKKWISPNEIEVLFLFKPFGKELGIKPKYMYIRTIANIANEKHIYTSVDIDYPYAEELQNYEKVKNIISTMIINFESNHKININYIFKFELAHTLPIYMENILGLIMKKMFLHLKQFIEIT